jgi:hypothetical protein
MLLCQGLREAPALGHILKGADEPNGLPVDTHGRAHGANPSVRSVAPDDLQLEIKLLAVSNGFLDRCFDERPRGGRIEGNALLQRRDIVQRFAVDAVDFGRPANLPGFQVDLPSANASDVTGLFQKIL